jgi:protoporphyrinogen oxidase
VRLSCSPTTLGDVLILGAGPAGLGAAYRLARAGREVTVLERDAGVGGLAASFDVAGVRVDHGSHRLHPTTPAGVMATLHDLLGADLQRRRRNGRIRMADRFVRFPPQPVDLARHLPPRLSARLAFDIATSPWRRPNADTFSEVVRASLGPTLTGRFYAPYVEKLFGVPAHALSGELARRRVGTRDARALLQQVVTAAPERGVFFYPRRGYGQISDALAQAAAAVGACIYTGTEVVRITTRTDAVEVTTADGRMFRAAQVWSTVPLQLLARLAGAPADVADAAARLETRPLTLVYLVIPRPQWTEFDAHYFPERATPMVRVSEPKNYRDSAEDPRDVTVLCAEVPGELDDVERVVDALRRNGLPTPRPVHVKVRRVPRAYPVYRVGFEGAFETLDRWARRQTRLLSFGRQGLFAHDNTHHALAMAWAAADAYSGDAFDGQEWSRARQRFRAHVVED